VRKLFDGPCKTARRSCFAASLRLYFSACRSRFHFLLLNIARSLLIAAEFVGRFQKERNGLPAIALTVDTSILTAVANDYGYDTVFARQVQALGNTGDVLVGLSTSGNSKNVLAAIDVAKAKGIQCIGMTAQGGGKMAEVCDICMAVPCPVTARAQEIHILIGHILCELVDGE
jgi:D-sedoheptulose 7-phosphate isomerase